MMINTTTGNENWETASAKVQLFFTPTTEFAGREIPVWRLSKGDNPSVHVTQRNNNRLAAAPGLIDTFGYWNTSSYEVPNGVLLKLFMQRKQIAGGPGSNLMGSLFIRMREQASLRRVTMRLTGDPRAAFTSVHTEGRFDIFGLTQAETLGAVVDKFRNMHNPDVRDLLFECEVLGEGTPPPINQNHEIENSQGNVVVVREIRPRRALDLG